MHAVEPNHDHSETSNTGTLLTKRLHELRQEFARGEEQLTELERKRAQVRDTLLRISGAMQVLEELLHEGNAERGSPASDETPHMVPTGVG
jgi:uncharacterized coiled-coil protein SlyX